jgi:hypothetical protein
LEKYVTQPPEYRSSGYPNPDPQSHPGYGQSGGQPGYQYPAQPSSYPGYGQPAGQSHPGYEQPHAWQETPISHHAAPTRPKKSLGSWFSGLSGKGKFRVILFAAAILVLPFAIYLGLDEPTQAEVGDCMAGQSATDLRIVACSDASAEWIVLARLEGKTAADLNDEACGANPETAASFYQDGARFRKGFILCLGPANT